MSEKRSQSWVEKFTSSHKKRRLYEGSRLILHVTEAIAAQISDAGLSRAEVARRMGRSAPHVTQLLAGDRNMTLRSAAELAYSCGVRINVTVEPVAQAPFVEATTTVVRPVRSRIRPDVVEGPEPAPNEVEPLAA